MLCTLFSCFIPKPAQQFTFSLGVRCQVSLGVACALKAISVHGGVSNDSNIVYNTDDLYDNRSLLILRVKMESDFDRH